MNPSKTQKNKKQKTKEAKRKRQAKIANDISNDTAATSIS